MAPELLSGKSNMVTEKVTVVLFQPLHHILQSFAQTLNQFLKYSLQIDVYSFGIVMWELLTGDEPYADMHCASIIGTCDIFFQFIFDKNIFILFELVLKSVLMIIVGTKKQILMNFTVL